MFVCLRRGRGKGAQFDNVSITSMFVLRLRRERGKAQLVVKCIYPENFWIPLRTYLWDKMKMFAKWSLTKLSPIRLPPCFHPAYPFSEMSHPRKYYFRKVKKKRNFIVNATFVTKVFCKTVILIKGHFANQANLQYAIGVFCVLFFGPQKKWPSVAFCMILNFFM